MNPLSRLFSLLISQPLRALSWLRSSIFSTAPRALTSDTDSPTVFDKVIRKEIPSTVVYADEKVLAFRDRNPQAPVHILLIPKVKNGLTGLSKVRHIDILGRLLYTAKLVAQLEGLKDGFRIIINDGAQGCQSVYHIHAHLIGGRQLKYIRDNV